MMLEIDPESEIRLQTEGAASGEAPPAAELCLHIIWGTHPQLTHRNTSSGLLFVLECRAARHVK